MSFKEKADSFEPSNEYEWRKWLEQNGDSKDSVWLIIHKKASPNPNLTWSQAVDHALCFGWIDSVRKTIDAEKFKQYFCKRKPKSTWSKVNKEKVEKLMEAGLMKKEGLNAISLAKENGSWQILDSIDALTVPIELEKAFKDCPEAESFYSALSHSKKRSILYWVVSAKRIETKEKRIQEFLESALAGKLPSRFS